MTDRGELRALTGMRGIAAWFVVLFHIRLSIAGLPPALLAVFAKGYLAVDFFFLLSGFVMWLSWSERLRGGGVAAVPRFLQKRIARVWPLHLFMLGATVALALTMGAAGRYDWGHYPPAELPLHFALLQNWGFTDRLAWNDPSWSISAELGAYLLFPALALAIDWRGVPSGAIVAALAALFVVLHAAFAHQGATTLGYEIARFGLLRCLVEFAAGTATAALWLHWRDRPAVPATLAALGGLGLLAGGLPETLAVPPAFAALLFALALTSGVRGNPLETAVVHYAGEISYATYLGHFLLFVVFKLALVDDVRAVPPVLIALYLAMVLAMSVALHHLVERPAQRWVNGLSRPPRLRRRAA